METKPTAKNLRNLRTGVKQGDFRALCEKSCDLWRQRPKRTRARNMLYCLARAILTSRGSAPNRIHCTLWREHFFPVWRQSLQCVVCYLHGMGEKFLEALAPSGRLGTSFEIACSKQCKLFWLATKSPRVSVSGKTLRNLPSEDDHLCAVLFVLSYFVHGMFGFS